jgi:hypothetical protein
MIPRFVLSRIRVQVVHRSGHTDSRRWWRRREGSVVAITRHQVEDTCPAIEA